MTCGDMAFAKLSGEVIASAIVSIELHKQYGFIEEGRFRAQYRIRKKRIVVTRLHIITAASPENHDRLRGRTVNL